MRTFIVNRMDGSVHEVQAHSFNADASVIVFQDETANVCAAFNGWATVTEKKAGDPAPVATPAPVESPAHQKLRAAIEKHEQK